MSLWRKRDKQDARELIVPPPQLPSVPPQTGELLLPGPAPPPTPVPAPIVQHIHVQPVLNVEATSHSHSHAHATANASASTGWGCVSCLIWSSAMGIASCAGIGLLISRNAPPAAELFAAATIARSNRPRVACGEPGGECNSCCAGRTGNRTDGVADLDERELRHGSHICGRRKWHGSFEKAGRRSGNRPARKALGRGSAVGQ